MRALIVLLFALSLVTAPLGGRAQQAADTEAPVSRAESEGATRPAAGEEAPGGMTAEEMLRMLEGVFGPSPEALPASEEKAIDLAITPSEKDTAPVAAPMTEDAPAPAPEPAAAPAVDAPPLAPEPAAAPAVDAPPLAPEPAAAPAVDAPPPAPEPAAAPAVDAPPPAPEPAAAPAVDAPAGRVSTVDRPDGSPLDWLLAQAKTVQPLYAAATAIAIAIGLALALALLMRKKRERQYSQRESAVVGDLLDTSGPLPLRPAPRSTNADMNDSH